MRAIKYRDLVQLSRTMGPAGMAKHIAEAMEDKDAPLRPADVDFCELAEAFFGHEFRQACNPNAAGNDHATRILEAADGVDSTAFLNITGRVISKQVMDAFLMESAIAASLVDLETNVMLRHERRPGITSIGDQGEIVHEGMPYPAQEIGEKYQDFSDNHKRGMIVGLTKEALFFTGQSGEMLRQAGRVGEWLGVNKDKRIWNVILGIANNFNYNGAAYNTYNATNQQVGGNTMAPANIHDRPLRDWTDIDYAERWFDDMTDPDNGESIEIGGQTLIVMPPQWATARRILGATTVWHGDVDAGPRGGISNTIGGNPLAGYTLAEKSRRAYQLLVATNDFGDPADVWLLGNPKKAFVYRENWPVTVTQEPINSTVEFEQDIVVRFKASERGGCWVKRPHYMVISSGSCGHSSSGETICEPDAWPAINANAEH